MNEDQKDARLLIGIIVHDGVMTAPLPHFQETSLYFFMDAWGMSQLVDAKTPLPEDLKLYTCVESRKEETHFFGTLQVQRFPKSFILKGIKKFNARYKRKSPRRDPVTNPTVVLGIGRKSFCRAFVRFWATGCAPGDDSWEKKMLEAIDAGKTRSVIWIDSEKDFSTQTKDIADMAASARRLLNQPIR